MSNNPDSPTVQAEGTSLGEAIREAARQLGVDPGQVAHKLDREHFRSTSGSSKAVSTVRIEAWVRNPGDAPPPRPAPPPSQASDGPRARDERTLWGDRDDRRREDRPRESRSRDDRPREDRPPRERPAKREVVAVDVADKSGGEASAAWLRTLLAKMGLQGTVEFVMDAEKSVVLRVDTPDARFIVGRRGSTLRSIQTLLETTLSASFAGWVFSVDVIDDRPDRPERSDRGDRRPEGRGRGPRRGGRRDDGPRRRTDGEIDELKSLARKLADKALSSGESVSIRRELNSFERRIVHVEVASIAGVRSESHMEGEIKRVVIIPDPSAQAEAPSEGGGSDTAGSEAQSE